GTPGARRRGAAGCAAPPARACGCRTAAAASRTAAGCGAGARRRRRRGRRAAGPAAGRARDWGGPERGLPVRYSFDYSTNMETNQAIAALTALGHATRLAAFRLLVEAGRDGRMAGEIAEALGVPGATLSFHLKELVHAGLVESENRGRNVCYRARFDAMNGLVAYLTHNCCADSPDEA